MTTVGGSDRDVDEPTFRSPSDGLTGSQVRDMVRAGRLNAVQSRGFRASPVRLGEELEKHGVFGRITPGSRNGLYIGAL